MKLGRERRVVLAAAGLAALTLLLFGMEWRTLSALEEKTAYAVQQDLRQAADTVERRMYAALDVEARALDELDHQILRHGTSEDLAAAAERAIVRSASAASAFALVSCDCGDQRTSVERRRGVPGDTVAAARNDAIRAASRLARPLPYSRHRDLSIAPSPDGGVYIFRTDETVVVGLEITGETWRGPVLAAAAARVPRQPGQPEMEFSVSGSVGNDLAVAAGYRGVTVAGLARKQFRVQLGMMTLVLGLIAFGVFYTLRGIQKEARFLAQMSHEMKTPLATIHLYAETLEMGRVASDEKRNTYLRRIREEAERLGAMVGDMISAGRKRYRMAPVDAEVIAEEALQSFEQAHLQLDTDDLPPVRCDREAVSRALRNLLSNAVKYGANSPVELRVGRTNGHVLFSVADHGIGIPKDQQRRIFERFYRIDESIPGTGLGLAIAREIVAAHRGEIRVDSAPGKGSTFTIALPAAEETACQPS